MLDWLLTPFQYSFMLRGLFAVIMVGILCSVIGCYVIIRSMAFLGDAIAHAILPGIAVAYLIGINLLIGAMVAGLLVALGIGLFSRKGVIKEDTAIGILFSAALSLGIVMISSIQTYAVDLSHILFGNVLAVSVEDLWVMAGLSVIVLGLLGYYYKELMVVSFDPILAALIHIPVTRIRNLMLILLASSVVISLQTVGISLVASMLVTPAATAYLLSKRLPVMMALSALIGSASGVLGLFLSYYLNVASGAAVVLTATMIFLMVYIFTPGVGFIWRRERFAPTPSVQA